MPVFQRKALRQGLGLRRLYECYTGTTSTSLGAGAAFNITVQNHPYLADSNNSGQISLRGAWLRIASADYRIASVNFGSGAVLSGLPVVNPIASGADFEIHSRLSATDMDACINQVIPRFRVRQEVGIPTVDGLLMYTIDGAASPGNILDMLDCYYFANPTSSVNRDVRHFTETPGITLTATGRELRIPSALTWSQQLVIDALVEVSLGADDAATVNFGPDIQDDQAILDGAAAMAYHLMIQRSPGQETGLWEKRRREMAMSFTRAMAKQQPNENQQLGFEDDFERQSSGWI